MKSVLHLTAYFGITVLIGITLILVNDFITRGLRNRRARLAEEARNATN